jgi:hypothetical protein
MKIGTQTGARIYLAPSSGATTWTYRAIFSEADIPSIVSTVSTVRHPLALVVEIKRGKRRAPERVLVDALNAAARDYFKYAGDERAGTPSDFVKWSEHVSEAGAALLRALGIDPAAKPAPMSRAAFVALCMRPRQLTARNYGVKNHAFALEQVASAAAYIHDLGKQAAGYHASRTVPLKDRARRGGLSARQEFLLLLARAYERSFGEKVPKAVNPAASPFVRFALWAYATLAERMVKLADQVTDSPEDLRVSQWRFQLNLPDEVWELIAPYLGTNNIRDNAPIDEALAADCAAAVKLGRTEEQRGKQIADDIRSRVYEQLRAARPVWSPLLAHKRRKNTPGKRICFSVRKTA